MRFFNNVGDEISFKTYIEEFGGPDMYHRDFKELLSTWRQADWVKTSDFIAPMAAQIITDACEMDKELYEKIMTTVEEAFIKLEPLINPPHLTRIK
jgi:hypothetical protein